jgi:seryl-tRNA synthetase
MLPPHPFSLCGLRASLSLAHIHRARVPRAPALCVSVWAERFELDEKNKAINSVQRDIGAKKKANEPCEDLVARKRELETTRDAEEKVLDELQASLRGKLVSVGNIVDPTVPDSQDEVRARCHRPCLIPVTRPPHASSHAHTDRLIGISAHPHREMGSVRTYGPASLCAV